MGQGRAPAPLAKRAGGNKQRRRTSPDRRPSGPQAPMSATLRGIPRDRHESTPPPSRRMGRLAGARALRDGARGHGCSASKGIAAGRLPELVWLLEHPPLYTAGTSAGPAELLDAARFPVHSTGRGGRYTYHGPGQRVGYVMLDVGARFGDVRAYVAALEGLVIDALARLGVAVANDRGPRRRVGARGSRGERGGLREGRGHRRAPATLGELARVLHQRRARPRALLRHRAVRHRRCRRDEPRAAGGGCEDGHCGRRPARGLRAALRADLRMPRPGAFRLPRAYPSPPPSEEHVKKKHRTSRFSGRSALAEKAFQASLFAPLSGPLPAPARPAHPDCRSRGCPPRWRRRPLASSWYSSSSSSSRRTVHPLAQTPVSTCEGLMTWSVLVSPSMIVTL